LAVVVKKRGDASLAWFKSDKPALVFLLLYMISGAALLVLNRDARCPSCGLPAIALRTVHGGVPPLQVAVLRGAGVASRVLGTVKHRAAARHLSEVTRRSVVR
jgi:hypothetical protein